MQRKRQLVNRYTTLYYLTGGSREYNLLFSFKRER
nr:MAG TPA: hypothetical protein [Caudoviricetes sp.]